MSRKTIIAWLAQGEVIRTGEMTWRRGGWYLRYLHDEDTDPDANQKYKYISHEEACDLRGLGVEVDMEAEEPGWWVTITNDMSIDISQVPDRNWRVKVE